MLVLTNVELCDVLRLVEVLTVLTFVLTELETELTVVSFVLAEVWLVLVWLAVVLTVVTLSVEIDRLVDEVWTDVVTLLITVD